MISLSDIPNVLRLSFGKSAHDLSRFDRYINLNVNYVSLNNCFNNQIYDYVYLKFDNKIEDWYNSFNNCSINNLVLSIDKFSDFKALNKCFKFTVANNIMIHNSDNCSPNLSIQHLIHRLQYMRGVSHVQSSK